MLSPTLRDDPAALTRAVKQWARELGFQGVGIAGAHTADQAERLDRWLAEGRHAEMAFMETHRDLRLAPERLHPGTTRILCVRMDYLPPEVETVRVLQRPEQAYISRYALGRDYHKVLRKRLARLARQIEAAVGPFNSRPFVDSAPVLEKPLAQQAGLGWQGKHSLIIDRKAGSYFVLGELFTDLPLEVDAPYTDDHCRRCQACLEICPTNAFPRPYVLDAGRCISYLTIEHKGAIPEPLRPLIGNRVFGCDDCQLVCPWNRYSHFSQEADFSPRHGFDQAKLTEFFAWDEARFLKQTEGSPIRRTGYTGWLRNLAVGLGNSAGGEEVESALKARADHPSELVREHVRWALARLAEKSGPSPLPLVELQPRKVRHLR
ncbi:tRNA epoxyqueuosine(34) reductase QueG [Motiliproteus sp. SC1-56]|uniref:tRNA epoxyqueuosine(34) reductase QueG n=1 Tax=Motiliproteus sp. SC1-56 TaxID=2799565 RepID=UPI001A8F2FFD|nr:tRNA epoxyqueuosine(34) reductase QueG [Motiliproteus sp. SC1-56]